MPIPAIRFITRLFPAVMLCLGLCVTNSPAQQPQHWRFWDSKDGLVEGHTRYLQIDLEGNVWITHGAVNSFTQLDGITVNRIARGDQFAKICRGRDGQIWADDTNGFRRLENGKWLSYPVEEVATWKRANQITDEDRFFYYPISSQALLYLMPHRIAILNPQTGKIQPLKGVEETSLKSFLDLIPTRQGNIWVAGAKGFAQIRFGDKPQYELPEWTEYKLEKSGIETLEKIIEGSDGQLYLTGQTSGKKHRLVKFDGHSWNVLYEADQPFVRGWAEADGTVWLQCATSILRWRNNRLQEVERRGPLSGTIFSATPAENGAFWVATTQGTVRYAPALWRVPDGMSGVDNVVHCIYEDPLGRIWAAATNNLLLLENGKWRRFPVPDGLLTHSYLTRSLSLLPNGKLLVRLDQSPFVFLFDLKNGRFETLPHPLGHRMHVTATRDKGGVWLWTLGENGRNWLELYDGQEFKTVIEMDDRWTKDVRGGVRDMLETENGDLWIGSLNGPGLYQKGRLVDFSANQEVMQNGAFYLLEMDGGKVWVGGREKIYEYDGANWHVVLQGIDKVRSMIKAHDGTVWVAASSGIYRYKQGVWLANTEEDGLPGTIAYDVLEDSQGRIWAGTTRGISLFHPDADPDPPSTIISTDNNLRDAPPNGDVRLVFSGSDKWKYTLPERLLFSTRIDGGPWSAFTTAAEALFKGLPSGAHRFEVRAMDRNGNIDPAPAVFEFKVLQRWYREWGFLLTLGFASLSILLLMAHAVINYRQRGKFIQELDQARERYRLLFDSNPFPMWVYELETLSFLAVNQSAVNHYGYSLEEFSDMTILDIRPSEDVPRLLTNIAAGKPEVKGLELWRHRKKDGAIIEVEINAHEFVFTGKPARLVVINDITEQRELERQLQQAQKLESIGQLAAGIAHEINTPTQFVSDNTVFLRDAFTDLSRVIEKDSQLLSVCQSGILTPEIMAEVELVAQEADVEYLLAEIPNAIEQSLEGTRRIAKIVQSMKDFSHPGSSRKEPSDLNPAIQSTITVAQNEWKYVAEMETDFDANLPPVPCLLGEFNQVILNIIVNAAHATAEVVGEGSGGRGKIRITTRRDGDWAEVSVSDTGPGIPEKYRQKIFDPFFTTKEVGKGTGQGLAIAHRVVKKHGGTLTFETEVGKGTTFIIRLPLYG